MQLNVWNIEKGVFVLWTEKDIVVDYIWRDIQFFDEQVQSVKHFFVTGVLPELVGKWLCWKPVESSEGGVGGFQKECHQKRGATMKRARYGATARSHHVET